jgi:rod shape-determining protein MreB
VERRAVQAAIYEAGTRNVALVQEPLAAAVGAGLKVLSPKGSMIVDIGEGTTECAVISLGEIVVSRSQKIAGSSLDRAIINYLHNERRIEIGELTAERLKIKLGTATPKINRGEGEVIGRNLSNGMAINATVTSKEICYAIRPALASIVHQIRLTLESTPPELTSDICNNGIVLSGGGAMLFGLDRMIERVLEVPVILAADPMDSVAKGLSRINNILPARMRGDGKDITSQLSKYYESRRAEKINND